MTNLITLIPNYYVRYERTLDDKSRLKLGPSLVELLSKRNQYNIRSGEFERMRLNGGLDTLAFKGLKFATIEGNGDEGIDSVDTSSIDGWVYLSPGKIDGTKPIFTEENADRIFVYSATDLQRVYHGIKTGEAVLRSSAFRAIEIDAQKRIQMSELEGNILLQNGNRIVIIEGHPELNCFAIRTAPNSTHG